MPIKTSSAGLKSLTLAAVLVAGAAGCAYHDHHHEPDHVYFMDEHGFRHEGYYDEQHAWRGGYYDEQHGFHQDAPDWHRP